MRLAKIGLAVGALAVLTASTAVFLLPSALSYLNVKVGTPEPRPKNVPDDAVSIPYIAKSRLWAKCWAEGAETRCQIFDGAGQLLHDDAFVSYKQGASAAASSLEIVPERSKADYLWLKNGDVLVPKTNYVQHRREVERIIQKTSE